MAKQVSDRQKYLNAEYQRLRYNMIRRMRRHEAQGHKVDWSTIPRKPKKVTEKSLRTFEQGIFEQKKTGEYRFKRGYGYMARVEDNLSHTQYNQEYTEMFRKNREEIEARAKAKAIIGVDESREVSPYTASYIEQVKALINSMPDTIGFRSNANEWVEMPYQKYKEFFINLIDRAVAEAGVEQMEWYYQQKMPEIATATDAEAFSSDEDGVNTHDNELADLLYPYTVSYEMWEEMW